MSQNTPENEYFFRFTSIKKERIIPIGGYRRKDGEFISSSFINKTFTEQKKLENIIGNRRNYLNTIDEPNLCLFYRLTNRTHFTGTTRAHALTNEEIVRKSFCFLFQIADEKSEVISNTIFDTVNHIGDIIFRK